MKRVEREVSNTGVGQKGGSVISMRHEGESGGPRRLAKPIVEGVAGEIGTWILG